jgi:N-acetylneuraminic acid mutarotase
MQPGRTSRFAAAVARPASAELAAVIAGDRTWLSGANPWSRLIRVAPALCFLALASWGDAPSQPIPAAPTNLKAWAGSATMIALYWLDNSDNEIGFRIERCAGEACTDFMEIGVRSANTTSYGDYDLPSSVTYRYRVLAYNLDGVSDPSNIAAARIESAPPAVPTGLTATAVSQTQINLSWSDNSAGERGTSIERCTGVGCANFVQVNVLGYSNATSSQNTLLQPYTWYRYRVQAYNEVGASSYSDIASARTHSPLWTVKAPMATARAYAVSAVAGDFVLVFGGSAMGSTGLSSVETYSRVTNWWLGPTKPMPSPRYGSALGVLDGIIHVVGGRHKNATLATVEAYNPQTRKWAKKAPVPTPRWGAAAGVINGILYIVGGFGNGALATVEAYNPATDTWTTKAPLPQPRYGAVAGVVNGVLYVAGGHEKAAAPVIRTVEAYDPATNTWMSKAQIPTPRYHVAGDVLNGILYVVGGIPVEFGPGTTAIVEAYDPATDTWTTKHEMPTARFGATAVALGGKLYVIGGRINSSTTPYVPTLEVMQP